MSNTLDEFFEAYEATQILRDNLCANINALTDLSEEQKRALLRCHLIMIRQCLEDFGA